MHILSILLFSFSANLDTFLIGLACSLAGSRFPVKKNFLLSSICTAGTALAMLFGRLIGTILSLRTANLIGGILLIILGSWFTLSCIRSALRSAAPTEKGQEPVDNTASVLPLAIALSLNNFALGLGASITGLPVVPTSIATFASCYFLLLAGQWMGHTCLARFCGRYASLFSGLIILILGIYETFI